MGKNRGWALVAACAVGLALGGTLVALAYSYPKGETARRSYCTRCGMLTAESHEHALLGARRESSTKGSILTRVLAHEEHEHAWVEPWAHVFPTFNSKTEPALGTPPALKESLLRARLRDLDSLADTPHAIAVLDAAMANDPARARAFIGRLLDFDRHYPVAAVSLLDGREDWPARWAAADAFDRTYRCSSDAQAVRCKLTTRGQEKVVFSHDAHGRGQVTLPSLRDWSP